MNRFADAQIPATASQLRRVRELLHTRLLHPDEAATIRRTLSRGSMSKAGATLAIKHMRHKPLRPSEAHGTRNRNH